jgi:hypothetical protein
MTNSPSPPSLAKEACKIGIGIHRLIRSENPIPNPAQSWKASGRQRLLGQSVITREEHFPRFWDEMLASRRAGAAECAVRLELVWVGVNPQGEVEVCCIHS